MGVLCLANARHQVHADCGNRFTVSEVRTEIEVLKIVTEPL